MTHPLFAKHQETLERALQAIATRGYWSPFTEMPSPRAYGETAAADGEAAFKQYLNAAFPLEQRGSTGSVGQETSPFGFALGTTYPGFEIDTLLARVSDAHKSYRAATPDAWVGVSLEILKRLNARSFEMANAVMHTTG